MCLRLRLRLYARFRFRLSLSLLISYFCGRFHFRFRFRFRFSLFVSRLRLRFRIRFRSFSFSFVFVFVSLFRFVLLRFVFVVVKGVLVYSTEHLRSAAFGSPQDAAAPVNEEGHDDDNDEISPHGHVTLEQRPSYMAVSEDNFRVAVAVGDKVGAAVDRD